MPGVRSCGLTRRCAGCPLSKLSKDPRHTLDTAYVARERRGRLAAALNKARCKQVASGPVR